MLLFTHVSWAQEDQNENENLPDIAPREVEIRGQGDVSLPTLERQPIRELAPPPAFLRRPLAGSDFAPDTLAGLPLPPSSTDVDLPETDAPSVSPADLHGTLDVAGGRYSSRLLRGRLSWPFAPQSRLNARLNYHGRAGHAPFEDAPEAKSSSDVLDGQIGLETGSAAHLFRLEANGLLTDYRLFGVATERPGMTVPERQGAQAGLRAQFEAFRTREANLRADLAYQGTGYETRHPDQDSSPSRRTEHRLSGRLEGSVPYGMTETHLQARSGLSGFDRSPWAGPDFSFTDVQADVSIFPAANVELQVGGRLMGFDTGPRSQAETASWRSYLAPVAALHVYPAPQWELFATNRPALEAHDLAGLFTSNPYATSTPALHPSVRTIDVQSGVRWQTRRVRVRLSGRYAFFPSRLYFEKTNGTANSETGLFRVQYDEARFFGGEAALTLMLPGRLHTTLRGIFQQAQLTATNNDVPFEAPFEATLSLGYEFADHRGSLEVAGRYEAPRPVRAGSTENVRDFFELDTTMRYQLLSSLGLMLRVRNALPGALERWPGYPQPPLLAEAGLQINW